MNGIERIAEERKRQIKEKCYTYEHDDSHSGGELAGAGACYALWHAGYVGRFAWRLAMAFWPWAHESWNPTADNPDRFECACKDLAKSGALIAAEIDRLQRVKERLEQPRILRPGE